MCKIGHISALCGRESARREFARFRAMLWKWSLQQWGLHRRVRAHSGRHSHQFVERLPNVQSTRRTVWGGLHVPMQSPNIWARRWCPSTRRKKILQGAFGDTLRQYDVPGRTYFWSTAIAQTYNSVRSELQHTLLSVEEFSLTTDLWLSASMAPYMSLTFYWPGLEAGVIMPPDELFARGPHRR